MEILFSGASDYRLQLLTQSGDVQAETQSFSLPDSSDELILSEAYSKAMASDPAATLLAQSSTSLESSLLGTIGATSTGSDGYLDLLELSSNAELSSASLLEQLGE